MSEKYFELAKAGDIESLGVLIDTQFQEDYNESVKVLYQWLTVANALGFTKAGEMAEDIYATGLEDDGLFALFHYEVAEWFISGKNGVELNEKLGLDQLAQAEDLGLSILQKDNIDLNDLKEQLSKKNQIKFYEIFP